MSSTPGRTVEMNGACPGRMPKSPSAPGTTTISTSAENRSFSGETSSKATLSAMTLSYAPRLGRFGGELLGLLDRGFDGRHHVERRLRQVVVFAVDDTLEAFDGVGEA